MKELTSHKVIKLLRDEKIRTTREIKDALGKKGQIMATLKLLEEKGLIKSSKVMVTNDYGSRGYFYYNWQIVDKNKLDIPIKPRPKMDKTRRIIRDYLKTKYKYVTSEKPTKTNFHFNMKPPKSNGDVISNDNLEKFGIIKEDIENLIGRKVGGMDLMEFKGADWLEIYLEEIKE